MVPAKAIPVTLKVALPVLLRVKVWAALVVPMPWLLKDRLGADSPAMGPLPVPVRLMLCGLSLALSVRVMVAERVPVTVGEKVTLTVQLLPDATGVPQVLVWAKSPGFVPASTKELMLSVMLPVLLTVTD